MIFWSVLRVPGVYEIAWNRATTCRKGVGMTGVGDRYANNSFTTRHGSTPVRRASSPWKRTVKRS